jgi:hypothetical protein
MWGTVSIEKLIYCRVPPTSGLANRYRRRALRRAAQRAHAAFARQYPEWQAALFDEHFVARRVLPLLERRPPGALPTSAALAHAWAAQFGRPGAARRRIQAARLMPAAAWFLEALERELRCESGAGGVKGLLTGSARTSR